MAGLVDAINCTSLHTLDGSNYASVDFSVGTGFSGPFRVSKFSHRPRVEGAGSPKLNTQGQWAGLLDPRELVIDLEGRLMGSTPATVWQNRMELLNASMPPYDYDRTIREHSTLTVTFPNVTPVYALVQLVELDLPLEVDAGMSIPYRISWTAPFGYWRKVSNDDVLIV